MDKKYSADQVWEFLLSFKLKHQGIPPVTRDVSDHLGANSTSTARRFLHELIEQGRVQLTRKKRVKMPGELWWHPALGVETLLGMMNDETKRELCAKLKESEIEK